MILETKSDSALYRFRQLSAVTGITHFVSTRKGGVSVDSYSTLNLGFHTGNNERHVLANRKILSRLTGIPLESLTAGQQVHSDNIVVVDETLKGHGATSYESGVPKTDGLVTNVPNICLIVLVADCVPLLFCDPREKVVGIAHVGRKGITNQISRKMVQIFRGAFHCVNEDIRVGIGPSISAKYYLIRKDQVEDLRPSLPEATKSLKVTDLEIFFDLRIATIEQLLLEGIPAGNIEPSGLCTYHNKAMFYSERRDGRPTGRFCAGIMLTPHSLISP
ncbi:MAG: peptidoglycan editing factor PgeF [Nitrososphaera sp.]